MKRAITALATSIAVLFTSMGVASANSYYDVPAPNLSSLSSDFVLGQGQSTTRDLNAGLSVGLCSDGSINIAGLADQPGVYGVSLNVFGEIHPVMTARPFQAGEMVQNGSYFNIPAIPGLPMTIVASRAPVGVYDDTVRAVFSQTVLLTVPLNGCHYHRVTF